MKNVFFYKIKKLNGKWAVVFLNKENGEYKIIKDNINELREFIKTHNESILVGANNYLSDDKILTSLILYGNLDTEVTYEEVTKTLPITLDVSQGIVRNSLIDFHNMVSSLWDSNGNIFPYKHAVIEDDMVKQLIEDVNLIKMFSNNKERNEYLNWKLSVIKEYNLPKDAYYYSYGEIMRNILGLRIPLDATTIRKVKLDAKLEKAIKDMNNPFLNDLLVKLMDYYQRDDLDKLSIKIDDCVINFNDQGILGSMEEDYIDTNKHSNYAYLYIDFNSFGPNILINNNWLDGIAKYPEKYSEIKDRRISLKNDKNIQQLYYKYLLNSGLDYLNKICTKNGENIGLSLTITGVMTMMLLYKRLEQYKTKLIECNTDGLIVKCPKEMIDNIKNEVSKLANELSLSCDVDVVDRIAHFDTKSYVMEFEDGKQKHLGNFGLFQSHEYYSSGITAVEEALREYYLNGIPVSITLRNIRNRNDLKAFQIVKRKKANEMPKYIKVNSEYYLYDRTSFRLFAVRENSVKNSLYVKNNKGKFEEYSVKRGRSVKDGYYYFEHADQELPNIYDIDLTYYINECYKIINKHPVKHVPEIITSLPPKNCFIDVDGTLIKDKSSELAKTTFFNSVTGLIPDDDIPIAYNLFDEMNGCYLIEFLRLCKKYKGYGSIENFAEFLKSKDLFPGKDINVYIKFVTNFIENDLTSSITLDAFPDSKPLLDYLQSEGYNIITYSNWFKKVQEAKLNSHNFDKYMKQICTIDDYYAKSSVVGWEDLFKSLNITIDDFNIMIGNGTSDLVPKKLHIPSIIVNHSGKENGKTVLERGIIVNDFSEIFQNPNFYTSMEEIKRLSR